MKLLRSLCPLPTETVGIILGRSRWISKGSFLYSGNIDEDFKGEIKIMSYVKREMQYNAGSRIAQLVFFSHFKGKSTPGEKRVWKYRKTYILANSFNVQRS
jgi:deoxycytidine triphosphate deaminase